jgi:hypothetical protein
MVLLSYLLCRSEKLTLKLLLEKGWQKTGIKPSTLDKWWRRKEDIKQLMAVQSRMKNKRDRITYKKKIIKPHRRRTKFPATEATLVNEINQAIGQSKRYCSYSRCIPLSFVCLIVMLFNLFGILSHSQATPRRNWFSATNNWQITKILFIPASFRKS